MKRGNDQADPVVREEAAAEDAGHARVWEPVREHEGRLSPDNRRYLERVLRLRPDAIFHLTDGVGREAEATLLSDGAYRLSEELRPGGREPRIEITLFVSIIKGDRFETVIEKAVELGVRRIVPVVAARCVARPPAPPKLERWRKIAVAAMLQCGGCLLPEVADPLRICDLPKPTGHVLPLLLHEHRIGEAALVIPRVPRPASATWILSGPEGGFAEGELQALAETGWRPTWLGPRRFRADTAPLAATAALLLAAQE